MTTTDDEIDATTTLYKSEPHKMKLISGKRVDPLALRPEDIDITDIAHSLSRQCRYNGHTTGFYSVARHSVWVSDRLIDLGLHSLALEGLLHDAAEAYLSDMIRPLKQGALGVPYLEAEKDAEWVIAGVFGLSFPLPQAVKDADNYVTFEVELVKPNGARYTWDSTPTADYEFFMQAYERLH